MKKLLSLVLAFIVAFGFSTMAFADVAPPTPEYPMLNFPELPDYSGIYYVSNPDGAMVYSVAEVLPTGEVIPYASEIKVSVGYDVNGVVYLAGIYNYMPVIVKRADVSTRSVKPLEFDNPTIDVFAYDYIEVTYKETSELEVTKNGMVFKSSDRSVVTVDENGFVTATGEGTAYVKGIDPVKGEYDIIEVEVTFTWWQKLIRIFLLGFLWY